MTSKHHPWPENDEPDAPTFQNRGGSEFERMHLAERAVLASIAGAGMPADVSADVAQRLEDILAITSQYQVGEHERTDGWRTDLRGRGHALLPPYEVDEESEDALRGRVTFSRFYLGGNAAVHGGAIPLLFDDILGRIVNHRHPGVARTAFLHVDYRSVTPIDEELTFEATYDSTDGRKRVASARLNRVDGTLCAEGHGLFVQLLPGQP